VGRAEGEVALVYLFGGAATLLTTPLAGRLSDLWGKLPVFRVLALLTLVPVLAVTNLPRVSLAAALVVTTLMMVMTSGRWVPAVALITASAAPRYRGSFLSVNAAVQQVAMGLASLVGGALLHTAPDGSLAGFPVVGLVAATAAFLSVILGGLLRPAEGGLGAVEVLGETAHPAADGRGPRRPDPGLALSGEQPA
jgi:predicted MFS family arabinose efflux permease